METTGVPQAAISGIITLVMVIVLGVVTAMLDHHWSHYEIDAARRRKARKIYYTGAGVILALMLLSFIFTLV